MRWSLWEIVGDFNDQFSPLSKKKKKLINEIGNICLADQQHMMMRLALKTSLLWISILALKPSKRLLTREILSAFQKGLVNWSAWSHLINSNQRCQRWAISFRLWLPPPTIHPNLPSLTASTSSLADICASFPRHDYSCMATLVN